MEDEPGVSPQHLEWFQNRGISLKTLNLTKLYSGTHIQNGNSFTVIPDVNGRILVYPYFRGSIEVNAKYRAAGKKFYQKPNGEKTFWNCDILKDTSVRDGTNALLITEGENDALAAIEADYPYVVSVPDGAPPPTQHVVSLDDIDPEFDTKYLYIHHNWEQLKAIRRIIIATDADDAGKRLAEELVRRLGRVRCLFIEYPEGCKDLNEVLVAHGPRAITRLLVDAKPYPVSGVYTFSQLPAEPDLQPLTTGWGRLDEFLKPFYPAFMVVTGTAGSGKSTWVNQLVAQMSILHGIRIAIASFEMRINPFVSEVLLNTAKEMRQPSPQEWLEDNFIFIAPEPDGSDQKDIDWIIEKASAAVIRHGIRILVLDPWNQIEHAHRKYESLTEYTNRAIRAIKDFGREFNCLVIVVAHPTKSGAEKAKVYHKGKGEDQIPTNEMTLYDVSDSAHFSNAADFGVVINRIDGSYLSEIMIKKVRYQTITGVPGTVSLTYHPDTRTFGQV